MVLASEYIIQGNMLTETQCKLLEMIKWFHNYCIEHKITYYCIGGTLLGAVRHKGFIPWDDDIDVGVPRKDYERLVNIFDAQNGSYILEATNSEDKSFVFTYAKLYDSSTTLVEKARVLCKRGLYIDIFPLDCIGNTIGEARKNFTKLDRKKRILMSRTCSIRRERKWYKNLAIIVLGLVPDLFINNKKLAIAIDKIAKTIDENNSNSIFIANLMGVYRTKYIMKRQFFGKPTLYVFEDAEIYGPEKYDEYLSQIYGNWRMFPPVDKRKSLHDYVYIDLNKSFLKE